MKECKVLIRRRKDDGVQAGWEDATFHEFSQQDVPMRNGNMRRMPVAIVKLEDGPLVPVRLAQLRFNPNIEDGAGAVEDGEDEG